jgi:hypothetical protein
MRTQRLASPLRHRLILLLWLALLLPLAQLAGTWHAYSHLQPQASQQDRDKQAPQADHCDLCLAAADVGSGGLLRVAQALPTPAARHVRPRHRAAALHAARVALAYRSRAPPVASL